MASKQDHVNLSKLFLMIKNENDMEKLLGEIFSPAELERASQRLTTTIALLSKKSYRAIEKEFGTSTYVVYRTKKSIVKSKHGIVKRLLKSLGDIE